MKVKSAWLGTWDGTQEDGKRIAFIMNYRYGSSKVADFMERLYAATEYGVIDQIRYAKNPKHNPYQAKAGVIKLPSGEYCSFGGQITCGHNPFIYARMVANLEIIESADGEDELIWEEAPLPVIK